MKRERVSEGHSKPPMDDTFVNVNCVWVSETIQQFAIPGALITPSQKRDVPDGMNTGGDLVGSATESQMPLPLLLRTFVAKPMQQPAVQAIIAKIGSKRNTITIMQQLIV